MIGEKISQFREGIVEENWKKKTDIRYLLEKNQVISYKIRQKKPSPRKINKGNL